MPDRVRRVAALIKQNVARILIEEPVHPLMQWITITDCVMSRDLKHAKLYFSTIEQNLSHEKAQEILKDEKKAIKRRLAKRIVLKYMPELEFVWDNTILIDEKIREIHDGKH